MKLLRNNINHSVCRWPFNDIDLDLFLEQIKSLGIKAVDLVGPEHWPILKRHDVYCSMCNGAEISLTQGWNNLQFHETLISNYTNMIPLVAEAGYKNLICFSGNRQGMNDEEGLSNCVKGLSSILPLAEKYGVTLCMELFNQRDHPDYMCDSTVWGVTLCKRLNSNNFKLLFDIYHMQIQEGDIIHSIRKYHHYIGHYHTAGVPGRNEINSTQELNYPAIMKAICVTGFQGFVAQEFIPRSMDKISSLNEAILLCDV